MESGLDAAAADDGIAREIVVQAERFQPLTQVSRQPIGVIDTLPQS
jgi:hypothetical protein